MNRAAVSNDELLTSLKALLGSERRAVAEVIACLVEVEERRLHLELACSSMFDFCTRRLGLSEGEAFRRLTAARLAKRFPKLLEAIASGRVLLSNVVLLRDLFTEQNVDQLLAAATGKTKREVEELVARVAPKPDVVDSIRRLPRAQVTTSPLTMPTPASPTRLAQPPPQLSPLAEDRYRIQLTASRALRDKIEHARSLMRHRNPSGDMAVVVDRALDLLIGQLEKERLGKTQRPPRPRKAREPREARDGARISRAVRRDVTARDGGQCTFVSSDGERCSARDFLELDHRHPKARGGTGDAANVRVLCRAHNRLAAEHAFGRKLVDDRIHFRQEKLRSRAGQGNPAAPSPRDPSPRERVQSALVSMGFRKTDADRALDAMDPSAWSFPIEALVREALGRLT